MKFIIFISIVLMFHLSDAQFWTSSLRACLTCDYPLFSTFINGYLPNGDYQAGYPQGYRQPCDCPNGIQKSEINHACFPNHVLYPYYESCQHKAYCCEYKSYNCKPSIKCPPNQHIISTFPPKCTCQCNNYMLKCFNLTVYNEKSCECECPFHAYLQCASNQYFDPKTCSCLCKDPCQDCSKPQTWNPKACNCECPFKIKCNTDRFWNNWSCKCECKQKPRSCCPEMNKRWDSKNCNCVCDKIYKCPKGQVWNHYKCKCEWYIMYQPMNVIDSIAVLNQPCDPEPICNSEQILNTNTCECEWITPYFGTETEIEEEAFDLYRGVNVEPELPQEELSLSDFHLPI